MGLDQYLTRKHYIGANFAHRNIAGEIAITANGKPINIDLAKVSYIDEQVGYWRKANQIHKWFVDNVQDGNDDCGSYYVSREQLQELLNTVNDILDKVQLVDGTLHAGTRWDKNGKTELYQDGKVIANPEVCEALPTTSGCFFGNTDYNEWYVRDLEDTKKILEDVLRPEYEDSEYEYHASW